MFFGIGVISLISLYLFSPTLAYYHASGESNLHLDLAYSLLNTTEDVIDIPLTNIIPDGNYHSYDFAVMNYDGDKLIDINMDYTITFMATTNLPIEYKLYDSEGVEIELTNQIEKDKYGTPFYVFKTPTFHVGYKEKVMTKYTIKYKLDNIYSSDKYQNIIELLSIKIDALQV